MDAEKYVTGALPTLTEKINANRRISDKNWFYWARLERTIGYLPIPIVGTECQTINEFIAWTLEEANYSEDDFDDIALTDEEVTGKTSEQVMAELERIGYKRGC